jgi:hypothetical protein
MVTVLGDVGVAVGVRVDVGVLVREGVSVGKVPVGVGVGSALLKVCVHTGRVVPVLYMLTVKVSPLTVMYPKPCAPAISG